MGPSAPDPEIPITLEKSPHEPVGLQLDLLCPKFLQVLAVKEGEAAHNYNASADADRDIRVGDFIVEVNDHRVASKMISVMKGPHEMYCIKVVRPEPFPIHLRQRAGALLPALKSAHGGRSLCVNMMCLPPLMEWNEDHEGGPDLDVKLYDCIVEINGKSGSAGSQSMLEEVELKEDLEALVVRVVGITATAPELDGDDSSDDLDMVPVQFGGYGSRENRDCDGKKGLDRHSSARPRPGAGAASMKGRRDSTGGKATDSSSRPGKR